jgi:hypothetical protein
MTVRTALARPYDVASGALGRVPQPAGDDVPVTARASAPAVAGLVDQRRRERRLIQKAPADSATRTPIHPAKRSSEDRCIVSGSSTTMRVAPTVRGRTGGDALVLDTDWHPNRSAENGEVWVELDATETVARRQDLVSGLGRLEGCWVTALAVLHPGARSRHGPPTSGARTARPEPRPSRTSVSS